MVFRPGISVVFLVIAFLAGCQDSERNAGMRPLALEFRLAFEEAADCPLGCQAFEVVDVFGKPELVHAPVTAAISIPAQQIVNARAWSDGESSQTVALSLSDSAASEVSAWARKNAGRIEDRALVTLNGSAIDVLPGLVLSNSNNLVVLPIHDAEVLERMREQIAVTIGPETDLQPADRKAVCALIAGSDEGETLDRIEAELDSTNPDYDRILDELSAHE
jgi:hypothetical protein